ncbi:oxidoreductase [Allobranchiibius sp. GilTou38]|uniref:WD40/YVTN/BNR-like repeat-containing protein n=1 Tax=Allobranchiibius sp. GilTou38 TaxID=2815210 RepID=UPI001AA13212|nr:oxidoreductase [Allobranchiibius sp. GilTou38]MBO1765439.1 oxidoreductase [Allobranchiibius sp. GilTou38]
MVLRARLLVMLSAVFAVLGLVVASPAHATVDQKRPQGFSWRLVPTGSTSHFRGLAAVSRQVAWLGGYDGTVLRTVDGGRTWENRSPAGASTLQFRDISATDATHAVAMAAGTGTDSRLYATSDGGRSWQLSYTNTDPAAFFDCMSFSDPRHGLVLSDPVDGRFRILSTRDGGHTWQVLPNAGMPLAQTGEAGFAASGECITTLGRDAWFGSGGGAVSRIYHSRDGGLTWSAQSTPIVSSASGGVFGLAFRTPFLGVAVGGDFNAPAANTNVAAYSLFGSPWIGAAHQPSGYRSGVTFVSRTFATVISVGLTGSDVSYDAGRDWHTFDTGQFDTVSCAHDGACWASGDLGRVAVLQR